MNNKFFAIVIGLTLTAAAPRPTINFHLDDISRSLGGSDEMAFVVIPSPAAAQDLERRLAQQIFRDRRRVFILDASELLRERDLHSVFGHPPANHSQQKTALERFLKSYQNSGGLIAINGLNESPAHVALLSRLSEEIASGRHERDQISYDLSRFRFIFTGKADFSVHDFVSIHDLQGAAIRGGFLSGRLHYFVLTKDSFLNLMSCEEHISFDPLSLPQAAE